MKALILTALIVLSALVAPATAVQDMTEGELTISQFEQSTNISPDPEFKAGIYNVTYGETAEITVRFADSDEATIVVGDEEIETQYDLVTSVVDVNGDGTVTLLLDTTAAHTDEQTVELADEDDELTIESEYDHKIVPRDYNLEIRTDGHVEHSSTLRVDNALEAFVLEESKELVPEKNQPIKVHTNLNRGQTAEVRIMSSTDAENPFVDSKEVTVKENGIVASEWEFFNNIQEDIEVEVQVESNGQTGTDTFIVLGESNRTSSNPSLEAFVTEKSKELPPKPNQPIEIQTNLDPGTTVEVEIQSSSSIENPFVDSQEVTVRDDGTVAPEWHFNGIENDIEVDVRVKSGGQTAEDTFHVLGESIETSPIPPLEASVTEKSKELAPESNQSIEIQTSLDAGENVTVMITSPTDWDIEDHIIKFQEPTVRADGTVAPEFDFAGIEKDAELRVSISHYSGNVRENVTVLGESYEPTPSQTESDESSTPGQPGFGALVAVVGLLAAVFMSRK